MKAQNPYQLTLLCLLILFVLPTNAQVVICGDTTNPNYISFENHIELHKESYYAALMNCQKNRYTDQENILEWVMFFLGSIKSLTDKLQVKLESIQTKAIYLTDRHKKIIAFINKKKAAKFADLSAYLSNIKEPSIKKDLSYLVQFHLIKKVGQLKATYYTMP